jgi:prevent-host-death family protein
MTKTLSKAQLKPHLMEYLREVEELGMELVVTHRGRPAVRIVPYSTDHCHRVLDLRGSVLRYDSPLEPVGEGLWEATHDAP